MPTSIDELSINTIRTLSMDAVQQANSGHPGTPMALAPVASTLCQDSLNYDPHAPAWRNARTGQPACRAWATAP